MEITKTDWERSASFDRWRRAASSLPAAVVVGLLVLFQTDIVKTLAHFCEAQPPLVGNALFIAVIYFSVCVFAVTLTLPSFLVARKFGLLSLPFSGIAKFNAKRCLVIAIYLFPFAAWTRFVSLHWTHIPLWIALAMILLSMIHSAIFPTLVMPFYFRVTDLPDGGLKDRIHDLFTRAAVPRRPLRVLHVANFTSVANAMVAGQGRHRQVIVTDTLLRDFSEEQVEAMLAHELGHLKKNHLLWRSIVSSTIMLALFGSLSTVANGYGDFRSLENFHGLLMAVFCAYCVSRVLLSPLARRQEFEADEFCIRVIPTPTVYVDALMKLHVASLGLTRKPSTHPALQKRLQRIHSLLPVSAAGAVN